MPTNAYDPDGRRKKMGRKTKTAQAEPQERHRIGPHGEKRPLSSVSNAVRVMEIATGLRQEEYADGSVGPHVRRADDD